MKDEGCGIAENVKTLGIVGGIGPESTIEYYRFILEGYRKRMPEMPSLPTNGTDISSTACLQFNSRGFPVAPGGLYITDTTRVFGSVTNAMGLVHTYEISASGSTTWTAQ